MGATTGLFLFGLVQLWVGGSQENTRGSRGTTESDVYMEIIMTWPKNLPGLGAAPERLAEKLRQMSNGRLDIKVYGSASWWELEVFDSVSQGAAEWDMVQLNIGLAKRRLLRCLQPSPSG